MGEEEEADSAAALAAQALVTFVKGRTKMPGLSEAMWTPQHDAVIYDFMRDPTLRRLLIFVHGVELIVTHTVGPSLGIFGADVRSSCAYFIKKHEEAISPENVEGSLQYGVVRGEGMRSLLQLMQGVYGPQLMSNNSWPESMRRELSGQYHKFMASLTETANQAQGKTVLYLPSQIIGPDMAAAAKDKEFVQQLESIVIHWTRQIKEVVNHHDNADIAEASGPSEEINFWKSRTLDLSGISEQLHRPDVRKVVAVLEAAKSSYLALFTTLSQRIKDGSVEAQNNLKFLESIREPCDNLSRAEPREIVAVLPDLLSRIRIIWSLSRFYNTEDRLTGLLRKISNEIINRCRAKIDLREIFDGDVDRTMLNLQESIECGVQWKRIYRQMASAIRNSTKDVLRHWNFDEASIFAQIDAFVQRCRDLLEVCEGQMQFARKSSATNGQPGPLPEFGATRGQEITKGLLGIEASFESHVDRLRRLDYDILDVKISRWHDDHNVFKNQVKDLDVMYTNVIGTAFEGVARVQDGMALLEVFYTLAKRDAIKRCVEKKTAEIFELLIRQVERTRHEFDENRRKPPLRENEPEFAGAALWARSLGAMVQQSWSLLLESKFLVRGREAADAEASYHALMTVLNEFKLNRYQAWVDRVNSMDPGNMQRRLETPLMRRATQADEQASLSPIKAGQLICNFDRDLASLFIEVIYWEKFHGEITIPYAAHDICNQREKLRVVREHVMLIVRAYNAILDDLSTEERRLFSDHVRKLDKRINQGLTKLTWASKGVVEFYVKDCLNNCSDVHGTVAQFKAAKEVLAKNCRSMASLMLIRLDKNSVYDEKVFEAKQGEHRLESRRKLESTHQAMRSVLRDIYANFKEGSGEVQREWRALLVATDKAVEQALRQTVKKSLQELSRAINGDQKVDAQSLFKVYIVLENNRVEYRPTMINLTHVVNIVAKELISIVSVIPRLKDVMQGDGQPTNPLQPLDAPPAADAMGVGLSAELAAADQRAQALDKSSGSFYSIITSDHDTLNIVVQVMNGMSAAATEMQKYQSFWDKYKPLWEMDKETIIRKYAKTKRTLQQYEAEITRYREQQAEIEKEDVTYSVMFIKIDCTLIKKALVDHCVQWQNKLTGLLNQNALAELRALHGMFQSNTKKLLVHPGSLDHLSENIGCLKELLRELPAVEESFAPLEEMYTALKRFDVQVPESEQQMLNGLRGAFEEFKEMLSGSEKMLDKSKQNMKRDLESSLETYNNQVIEVRQESAASLPFSADMSPARAFEVINDFKARAAQVRAQQAALKPGLDLFNIELPEHKELRDAERDLELMEQIWTITSEWAASWDSWKTGLFQELNVEDMELAAGNFNKKIGKLGREIKHWKVWEAMRDRVEQFRQTMPLIQDLKNKAMRQRHWDALRREINKDFDPYSKYFTLEQVFALGLHTQAEFIGELSANANKELAIEVSLDGITNRWRDITIDLVEYKEVYYKIRSTEDLFQVLEDDSVSLSTMKASKFYASFSERIDFWDQMLNVISEVVDLLLTVQRKWMYLESIFMAGGDIAKQLPNEYHLFREVNDTFKRIMGDVYRDPNAQRACKKPGLSGVIQGMDEKLETIQKCLDQYLETKRMIFPRFYFVSDDDLLEILGQSRDPTQVQKHIKKCFEGIKVMDLVAPGKGANKTYEARGMVAPDGETADFVSNVVVDGAVEMWLVELEGAMRLALQKLLSQSLVAYKGKKEKWVRDVQGQLLITTGAIAWTTDCSKALVAIQGGNKTALKALKKKQVGYLNRLTDMVRGQLTLIERSKLVALITMEIHNRDVMDRMIKANCSSVQDFEWLSQLRFVFYRDQGPFGVCSVKQTNSTLEYSYEYQGNNGRLVVTPLTDRCVLTLTTAMYLNRGGNPLGPAGTGKTETVKDLGKNLAKYVVVINCSDGQDYKSVGRIFSGLVQSGSWGCFDEFNRIKIEVISVVAMQVLSIVNAMSAKHAEFQFMGQTIKCNPNCGIFITMNPGYAGRTELPDNLKALMRPVAMMVPDLAMIAEVMLASEGFREAKVLAKKTITLYNLMIQQLSKQDHYDYGLRNLKAVLNMAGSLKRADPNMNEEAILMRALRDMNLPKFIKEDDRLFRLLLGDLFPSLEMPVSEYGQLQVAIERSLEREKLQKHAFLISKIIQLYDSKLTRHCNMLVGRTMSGKSVAWKTLAQAKTDMHKEDKVEGYFPVHSYVVNPKAVSLNELYGAYDLATFEWADGILSTIFKSCAENDKPDEKWIMFDGPVDALWIESMNSVMDDNKILTLINGDRIPLSNSMSLLFEVEDLSVASPATVSRAGMIYLDVNELGWGPYVQSWLESKFAGDPDAVAFHKELFSKYVVKLLEHKALNCREPVPIADFNAVQSLTSLYDALATKENGVSREANPQGYLAVAEKWFVFCLIWSVMAAVDEKGRKLLDIFLRDIEAQFPPTLTVYDYFYDPKKGEWEMWETRLPAWRPLPSMPFHKMIVPTTDTVRNAFVLNTLVLHGKHTLITGQTGTGKTVLAQSQLAHLPSMYNQLTINFSAATASSTTQDIVEGVMEKRSKDKFGPQGGSGKRLVIFIDDFNMPKKTSFESPFQPALELIRLWVDYAGWYDRQKCTWRYILDTQLVCAMGPPSGGRQVISARTQSRFNLINMTLPSDAQMVRIFESILTPKFADFDNEIKPLGLQLSQLTLAVYNEAQLQFLPTPDKFHYLFNIRDVAKVVQGLLQAQRICFDTRDSVLRLWLHECLRVFSDRFLQDSGNDAGRFRDILSAKLKEKFDVDWKALTSDADDPEQGPIFCSFFRAGEEPPYEEVTSVGKLKAILEEKLADYNMEPKLIPMNLVLFKDALRHAARIHRVLKQPRGNLMLVGVGGSGRQSLTKLASYMCEYTTYMIEITKQYRSTEFHEDLKVLYTKTGVERKPTTFLLNDTQIKDESFLEDINNILSSGEVPNLFGKDELPGIFDGVRRFAKEAGIEETPDELWRLFVENVRNNLHIVLAMSPVGINLRNRCRMYPGLVNCTTIDWFHKWPVDALQEVAMKFLQEAKLESVAVQSNVAQVFSSMHMSVITASTRMLLELKRHNYVTPTNYLELVKGYNALLEEKRSELGDSANKLANGLAKLEESRLQVERMSVELEKKKVVVAQAQKDCEELLVEIVSERRVADEQRKQVETDSERIGKEEVECKSIANDAQADLDVAMPALERAMAEVEKLDKNAISEVKAYQKPPKAVETVLAAVMTLFGQAIDWGTSKRIIGEANFLQKIKTYDKDNVSSAILSKIKKYVTQPDFSADEVRKISAAASTLCVWVHAIYIYANVAKEVAPKRQRLKEAMDGLASKQAALKLAQDALAEVTEKVNRLKQRYDDSVGQKNKLREEAEGLEGKLNRADQLVKGLSGEYQRWQNSIGGFRAAISDLVGDCLVASAFLSYAGPFDTSYRESLVKYWLAEVKNNSLPFSQAFNFALFLAKPTDVRDWNIQGLPSDNFSTENGVIVTRGSRWPLMIDPQGQANKWIRNMEGRKLRIIDLKMKDFLREVENGISYGLPVLLQDVLEELDPSLEPVLSKAIMKQGSREFIRLGDKELDYSRDFRLYITTKLGNPHYTPEVSTKTTVVNFAVKQQGLEAQLLGIVVQKEQPALEKQKSELVIRVAAGKRKLVELENLILRLLSESTGSLLDDEALVKTLQQSKVTSEEVTEQLKVAQETEKKIDTARESYRAAAVRASIAYFVLDDMSRVDPMYQYSLDAYVDLFNLSIDASRDPTSSTEHIGERCKSINEYHTLAVYQYVCRGLFERHKLLFSLQLCVRIMQSEHKIPKPEFDFFCYGGVVVDRSEQRANPCPDWIDATMWDGITELDKIPALTGLASSFEQSPKDWKKWFMSSKPEVEPLPADWSNKLSELQQMCIMRCLRLDRVLFAATRFVASNLGTDYADPPAFDLKLIYRSSSNKTPLIFVLSPGVDPTAQVVQLAASLDVKVDNCALGQGQAPVAVKMIEEALAEGKWVFLANCHLMLSWMPALEKIIEGYCEGNPHPRFRLWLSSSPHPHFPITILQRGIKMTTEPPRGLRANMLKLYNLVSQEQFDRCKQQSRYKKLLFSLCWFHAILLERRKFKSLGFNIPYDFNESDFSICHDLVIVFLDEYPEKTPFDAMRYLIAEANYGGRVTDDWDRRLVNVYINQFFCEEAVELENFALSELPDYFIPADGDLHGYKEFTKTLPQSDHPAAFGQHPNADISSQIEDTTDLLSTIVALQPKVVTDEGESTEMKVARQAESMAEQVPPLFDLRAIKASLETRTDPDPMKVVLLQEVERYNKLLGVLHRMLKDTKAAVAGLVVVTPELEDVIACLVEFRVPKSWSFCYPSTKPLGSWMRDLAVRCEMFQSWVSEGMPKVYWLPGFTYPTGFLTALLQTTARKNGLAIDSLSWEFPVLNQSLASITSPPKEGAYLNGFFLEGARWDADNSCLGEPLPMELTSSMPIIHFKPVDNKKKAGKGVYMCPLYMYPVRTGTRERPSFVIAVELKSGKVSGEFWTKRGTALLLATSQ